ncbi:MAG: hypothetical protein PHI90_10070 [Clostridia bacterium]|nr:hypothetical protein [Clostridia bacterium]
MVQILQKESLASDSKEIKALQVEREKVEKNITDNFDGKPTVRYAGSYKKGTMVKSSYDLDITCYFNNDDNSAGESLEDIYLNVEKALSNEYFVEEKKSALRLKSKDGKNDFHIDVVPGRFVDDSKSDTFLHQTTGDKERLKTNLDVHINHIKDSGLTKTIKMVKTWRNVYALDIKTFVLELLVVKALDKNKDTDGLEKCLTKFFEVMNSSATSIVIEDPANSNNDLSEIFGSGARSILSSAAERSLKLINEDKWGDIFGPLQEVDKDYLANYTQSMSAKNPDTPRPWLNI